MKKKNNSFEQIQILKERQNLRILEQELKIKDSFKEISGSLSGAAIRTRIKENLFSGSGLAFKLGYIAVTLLAARFRRKRRK